MQTSIYIKFKATLLLAILFVSSIGIPLITHHCNHEDLTKISLFAEEDHCHSDSCHSTEIIHNVLSFENQPCCSTETNIIKNATHLISKEEFSTSQIFTISYFLSFLKNQKVEKPILKPFKTEFHDLYGLSYRIAIQSFLC